MEVSKPNLPSPCSDATDIAAKAASWQPSAATQRRMRLAGLRPTRQRLAVLKALDDNAARFLDAEALHRATRASPVVAPLATVYRILAEMERARVAQSVRVGSRTLYRKVADDEPAQPHLVCCDCGLARPLGEDALMSQLFEGAARLGFRLGLRTALVGVCSACVDQDAAAKQPPNRCVTTTHSGA